MDVRLIVLPLRRFKIGDSFGAIKTREFIEEIVRAFGVLTNSSVHCYGYSLGFPVDKVNCLAWEIWKRIIYTVRILMRIQKRLLLSEHGIYFGVFYTGCSILRFVLLG